MTALLSTISTIGYAQIEGIDSIGNIAPATIVPTVSVEQSFDQQLIPPVLALTVPFIMVIAIVFVSMKYMTKEKIARYKVIEAALEKGVDLPQSFFEDKTKKKLESNLLYTSVRNILVGLVLFFGLWIFLGLKFAIWLLILTAVGAAQLITYLSESKATEFNMRNTNKSATNANRSDDRSGDKKVANVIETVEAEEVNAQDEHIDGEIK